MNNPIQRLLLVVLFVGVLPLVSRGQGRPPPGAPMPGMPGTSMLMETEGPADEGIEDVLRDPFWPIGWKPTVGATNSTLEQGPEIPIQPDIIWPDIVMKGVVKAPNGEYMARLDGIGWVKTGYTVSVKKDGYIFKWKINKVTDEAISVKKLEAIPVE